MFAYMMSDNHIKLKYPSYKNGWVKVDLTNGEIPVYYYMYTII